MPIPSPPVSLLCFETRAVTPRPSMAAEQKPQQQPASLEQEIDSLPLVDEDAADASDEEESPASQVAPANGFQPQIPHEMAIESMPSSGIGSPSVGPACR